MYPEGFLGVDWLRVLITPIGIFGISFMVLYLRNEGVRPARTTVLLILIAVVALLGAKLFSLYVRDWQLYHPLRYELRGGLRYPGALLAMVLLGPLLQRLLLPELRIARFLDVLAITVAFCFALVRISCFLNGCCTGGLCDYGYCLSFAPGSQAWYTQLQQGLLASPTHRSHPVLPLQFLFMGASFLVGLFLLWFDDKRRYDGQIALLYLFLHEGAKGLLESLREPYVAQLQITSFALSATGLALLLVMLWRPRMTRQDA